MKIYTKTGDAGETALFGGARVPKSHIRVEAYGTLDELNAFIGLLSDVATPPQYKTVLKGVQDRLFSMGASLASDPEKFPIQADVQADDLQILENEIDTMEATLPPLKNFILPGGHTTVSYCHIARTVCRRAERIVVALNDTGGNVAPEILTYLNRLSDYLFVLSRRLSQDLNAPEIIWRPRT
jgi:cob(I)alamin adenosyltransferase